MLRWWRNYKRALENVCCEEVLRHNIHNHIDYKERLHEIQEVVFSLFGDNSPEFNRQQLLELNRLVGGISYTPEQQENSS